MHSASLLWKTWANFSEGFGPVASGPLCCSKQTPIVNLPVPLSSLYIRVVARCHLQSLQEVGPSAAPWLSALKVSPCLYFQYLNICIDTHLSSNIFSEVFALQRADLSALSKPSSSTYSLLCEITRLNACRCSSPSPAVARGSQHLKHLDFFSAAVSGREPAWSSSYWPQLYLQ